GSSRSRPWSTSPARPSATTMPARPTSGGWPRSVGPSGTRTSSQQEDRPAGKVDDRVVCVGGAPGLVPMPERSEIQIQMMSNPLYLSGAREMVAAVARRLAFSDEACGQIALAVDEALCNVIRHGYGRQPDRPIWISLTPVGGVATPGTEENP